MAWPEKAVNYAIITKIQGTSKLAFTSLRMTVEKNWGRLRTFVFLELFDFKINTSNHAYLQTKFTSLFCNKTSTKHNTGVWCIGATCDCSNHDTPVLKLCWLSMEWKLDHFFLCLFRYSKALQHIKTFRKCWEGQGSLQHAFWPGIYSKFLSTRCRGYKHKRDSYFIKIVVS